MDAQRFLDLCHSAGRRRELGNRGTPVLLPSLRPRAPALEAVWTLVAVGLALRLLSRRSS